MKNHTTHSGYYSSLNNRSWAFLSITSHLANSVSRSAQSIPYRDKSTTFFLLTPLYVLSVWYQLSFRFSRVNALFCLRTLHILTLLPKTYPSVLSFHLPAPSGCNLNAISSKLSSLATQFRVRHPFIASHSPSSSLYMWSKIYINFFRCLFDVYFPPPHYTITCISAHHGYVVLPFIPSTWNST